MWTAWHEAGHAIVNLFLENSIPLHKVTIIPRGQALGLTMMMEHEDRYSRSRLEMLDIITTDLGGRVAEEIALGDITSGASQDIAHATNLARAMVCSYGMSDKLGTVQYGERADHIYLGREITRNESCSEQTQREIDDEVKRIISECKARATKIVTEQRERLDKLANALLERETISGEDIRKLLDLPPADTGEPDGPDAPDDLDLVTVHQEVIPTRIENAERWEGFLAAAERGEADSLTLRLIYEEGTYELDLRCDGEVFRLTDEGTTGEYKYLLASVEDTPRPGAKYRRAVHYLLSDDPDLTWEQYFSRMVSSSVLFDQAAARGLFTVYYN